MITLNNIKYGNSARIIQIKTDKIVKQRLMDMGVIPGKDVRISGCAPFGDPIILAIDNFRIAISRVTAKLIEVKKAGN